jgi:hypothetical protein
MQDRYPEETLFNQHGSLPPALAHLNISPVSMERPLQV